MLVFWICVALILFSSAIYCQIRCAHLEANYAEEGDVEDLLSALLGHGWCRGSTHESREFRLLTVLTIITGLLTMVEILRRIAIMTEG